MSSSIIDWNKKKLSEISKTIYAGATPNTKINEYWENGNIPWMSSGEINNEVVESTIKCITKSGYINSSTKMVPINSVLVALAGQGKTRGKVAVNKIELCTNQSLAAIVPNDQVFYLYLYYNLQSRYQELRELSSGDGTRGGLNLRIINEIEIDLPSFFEQKKIAEILSTWDSAIKRYEKMIELLQTFKNALIILISKENINKFKAKKVSLRNYLTERKAKSNGGEIVHSVSVKKGVINQVEHLGRVYATSDTSKYNLVKYADIVYTKSPTGDFPYGIIKQNKVLEDVIVSPLYGVYEPRNYYIGKYLNVYFESPIRTNNMLSPIIQKGAKNTINITNDRFLDGQILIPSNEYLISILAKIFDEIDEYLNYYEELMEETKKQKHGLMQRLLSGKIKVRMN